jgi:hypothetical protein
MGHTLPSRKSRKKERKTCKEEARQVCGGRTCWLSNSLHTSKARRGLQAPAASHPRVLQLPASPPAVLQASPCSKASSAAKIVPAVPSPGGSNSGTQQCW